MGNCLKKPSSSSVEWGGDNWGSFSSDVPEKPPVAGEIIRGSSSPPGGGSEVKIKISRKQLEQLVKTAEAEGLSPQQLLSELMDGADRFEAHHQRSWRPNLHSIPE